jgi:nucleotide-binding universal stress UspA family protein
LFQKVLVPIDGSEISTAALAYAVQVVGPETSVLLLQVVDSAERIIVQTTPAGYGLASASFTPGIVDSVIEAQRNAATEHLEAARAQLAAAGVGNVDERVVEGLPGEEIVRVAHEEGFDLVVMGTHGRSGLTRAVLGSVADHVVRHLDGIPVMLINPPEED